MTPSASPCLLRRSLATLATPLSVSAVCHDPRPHPRNPVGPRHQCGRGVARLRRDRLAPDTVIRGCKLLPCIAPNGSHPSTLRHPRVRPRRWGTSTRSTRSGRGPFLPAAPREGDAKSRNRVFSTADPRARMLLETPASLPIRGPCPASQPARQTQCLFYLPRFEAP